MKQYNVIMDVLGGWCRDLEAKLKELVASQGQKRLLEVDSRVCFLHGITFLGGGGGDRQQNVLAMSTFKTALPFVLEDQEILYLRHVYRFR